MKVIQVILSVFLLAACTTPQQRLTENQRQAVWDRTCVRLSTVDQWSMRGRVAVKANGRGWQASLRWLKRADRQEIKLNGPFGGGVVLLRQDASGATLRDNRGDEYRDGDIEHLLERVTGWRLPVKGMEYWVQGRVLPGVANRVELDGRGRVRRLSQQQWQISYEKFSDYQDIALPRRMVMTLPARENDGVEFEVRLLLNHWDLTP